MLNAKRKRAFTDLGDQRGFFSFDPGGCTSGLINTTRMNAKTCGAVPMVRIHLPPALQRRVQCEPDFRAHAANPPRPTTTMSHDLRSAALVVAEGFACAALAVWPANVALTVGHAGYPEKPLGRATLACRRPE